MLHTLAYTLYLTASIGLLLYGLNSYILLFLFLKNSSSAHHHHLLTEQSWRKTHPSPSPENLPKITTQLPLYNERNVAERAIRAIAALHYPTHLHQIQILDDSTDETSTLIHTIASELREKGSWIDVIHRPTRLGFKAGALAHALPTAHGDLIAIFDADFIPPPTFLLSLLPHFSHEKIALVQARWTHLNRNHSLLTRVQALGIDGHFAIDQTARSTGHLFLNFNGTAGIWRRTAILDSGGWHADTLTEDLDLSYRAQLRGWELAYIPHITSPAELPETYSAFKNQQFRWAKGSIQTAKKLLPEILRSTHTPFQKAQSILHLCNYLAHPLMFLIAALALPSLPSLPSLPALTQFSTSPTPLLTIPMIAAALGPIALYTTSQRHLHPTDWASRTLLLPALIIIGFGICLSNTLAILEALLNIKSPFIRTPKHGSKNASTLTKKYSSKTSLIPALELIAALYTTHSLITALHHGDLGTALLLLLYTTGFSLVGLATLREQFFSGKS